MATRQATTKPGVYRLPEKGKDWYELRISTGIDPTKKTKTGKPAYGTRQETFKGTLKEATARRAEMLAEVEPTKGSNIAGYTVRQLCEEHARHVSRLHSVSTRDSDAYRFKMFMPYFGNKQARSLTPHDIDRALDDLAEKRGWKPQTLNRQRQYLSSIFSLGVRWKIVSSNPVAGTMPRTPHQIDRPPVNVQETEKLIDALPRDYADFIELSLLLGCRRGELIGLQLGDYNPKTNLLTIRRAVKERQGQAVAERITTGDTKTHRERIFTPDTEVIDLIVRRIKRLEQAAEKANTHIGPETYLFSDNGGLTPWLPSRPSLAVRRMKARLCPECDFIFPRPLKNKEPRPFCPKCGITIGLKVTIQSMRRLNATSKIRAGVNAAYIRAVGGWANADTMLKHYTDHEDAKDAEASHAAIRALGITRRSRGILVDDN